MNKLPPLPPGLSYYPATGVTVGVLTTLNTQQGDELTAEFPFDEFSSVGKTIEEAWLHYQRLYLAFWMQYKRSESERRRKPVSQREGRKPGVCRQTYTRQNASGKKEYHYWSAYWRETKDGKRVNKHKDFSILEHGEAKAERLAWDHRAKKELEWEV